MQCGRGKFAKVIRKAWKDEFGKVRRSMGVWGGGLKRGETGSGVEKQDAGSCRIEVGGGYVRIFKEL